MNDRLLNNPIPPREIDPTITPQLQEIIYRALERDPAKRYANAREFARDLEHQDQVGVADRPELHDWKAAALAVETKNSLLRHAGADPHRHFRAAAMGGETLKGSRQSAVGSSPQES